MLKMFSALALMAMLAVHAPSHGGASLEQVLSGEALLSNGFYRSVVVARIQSVDGSSSPTNGAPPLLKIEILEVLKGSIEVGVVLALWQPMPHDVDWVGTGSTERLRAWAGRPNPPPEVGSTWILSSRQADAGARFDVAPRARWRFSESKRSSVIEILRAAATTAPTGS